MSTDKAREEHPAIALAAAWKLRAVKAEAALDQARADLAAKEEGIAVLKEAVTAVSECGLEHAARADAAEALLTAMREERDWCFDHWKKTGAALQKADQQERKAQELLTRLYEAHENCDEGHDHGEFQPPCIDCAVYLHLEERAARSPARKPEPPPATPPTEEPIGFCGLRDHPHIRHRRKADCTAFTPAPARKPEPPSAEPAEQERHDFMPCYGKGEPLHACMADTCHRVEYGYFCGKPASDPVHESARPTEEPRGRYTLDAPWLPSPVAPASAKPTEPCPTVPHVHEVTRDGVVEGEIACSPPDDYAVLSTGGVSEDAVDVAARAAEAERLREREFGHRMGVAVQPKDERVVCADCGQAPGTTMCRTCVLREPWRYVAARAGQAETQCAEACLCGHAKDAHRDGLDNCRLCECDFYELPGDDAKEEA
jgi:hypothetical protein